MAENREKLRVAHVATGDPLGLMKEYSGKTASFLASLDCDLYQPSYAVTSAEEAVKAVEDFKEKKADLILLQCNVLAGDGAIAEAFIRSGIPLAVWCVPEPGRSGFLYLNSITGANLYMSVANSNLRELDARVKWLYGSPDDPLFTRRLEVTVRALKAAKRLRGAKIAQIGGTAFGFINLDYDAAAYKERFGCEIFQADLEEIYDLMERADEAEVKEELNKAGKGCVSCLAKETEMDESARLILALRKFGEDNGCDAMAVSCWPDFQVVKGISACMAYGRLNDTGHICACEGDVPGAVSMLLLEELSGHHPMIMDMVAMDQEADALTFWHCGMGMPSYADGKGFSFVKYPAYPEVMDEPGVSVDMKFAPQRATIARIGRKDASSILICESDIIEGPDSSYTGARGWFSRFRMGEKNLSAVDFWNTVCACGNAHHYVISAGSAHDAAMEFAHRTGIEPVKAAEYHDYL